MENRIDTNHLDPEAIRKRLGESIFSNNIIFYERIESTNTHAKELASDGAPEGTIVLAEEQTSGRGRMGRHWLSHGYKNLLFSIILRPSLSLDSIFILTIVLSIAVIDSIEKLHGLNVMIKWPNDLYIGMKKAGGILSEFAVRDKGIEYVILGLGLNVNWRPEEKEGILYPATSIFAESGRKISRNDLLVEILKQFEVSYRKMISGAIGDLYERWNEYSLIMGKDVEIESKGEKVQGTAVRIDHQGALIIKRSDGAEHRILSGDVSLRF
jgi:BirA family biotin operon repressor/biotin-[acetyl-CoA-carboxylase] ligase